MKIFGSILIVNFIILTTFFIQDTHGKCIMRGTCAPHKELYENQNPLTEKWYNCKYDNEAMPLETKEGLDDFKTLCPSMYTHDQQPLCCNSEQLKVLKNDLLTAQTLIGSCSSCYFNFRQLWCNFACHPEQSDFLIPRNVTELIHRNFSQIYEQYSNYKTKEGSFTGDEYDYDDEDYEYEDEFNEVKTDENHTDQTNDNTDNNHQNTTIDDNNVLQQNTTIDPEYSDEYNYDDYDKTTKKRKRRSIQKLTVGSKAEAVVFVDLFISRTFMNELVRSCHDIQIYGEDALQGLCGMPSKSCSGQLLGDFLGLKVPMRPMNIQFNLKDEREIKFETYDASSMEKRTYDVKTIVPIYHQCNESYQYGDLEYAAKCSCKDCKSSCRLYDDLKIHNKEIFKIGDLDGASVIMAILWLLFLIVFFKSISFFKNLRANDLSLNISGNKYGNNQTPIKNKNEDMDNNLISPDQNDLTISPYPDSKANYLKQKTFSILDKMEYVGDMLERFIEERFTKMGKFCATYPILVLFIGIAFCAVLCLGYTNFKIENDPVKLWSADSSVARQTKKYFDENFKPFYRVTQLIIEPKLVEEHIYSNSIKQLSVMNERVLNETLDLYQKIYSIQAECKDCEEGSVKKVNLEDVCYQPLQPENMNCATQSVFQYWKNDASEIRKSIKDNNHLNHLQECMLNPFNSECLADFGGPIQPYMIAGSYEEENFLEAKSLVITFVLNNYIKAKNQEAIKKAMAWELEVLNLLKNYSSPLINVIYTTERSIEDELDRESRADMKIIGMSYIVMFFYLTLTLGKYSSMNFRVILIEMKLFLAVSGVILVILSVLSSGGFFTYVGVPATLISLEVIPFLLLAVGVDNIYVMVQTYQNDERPDTEKVEDQIARIVGKVGPSMLLTGTTQSAAFLISSMTPMPGVRAFSLYASLAIVLNFLLQITCFVALLSLDAKRERARRSDMLCCIKFKNLDVSEINAGKKSFLHMWFKEIYTPFLLNNVVRAFVIVTFIGFFFSCIAMCDKIKIGLDQKLTMSLDSYQNKYFTALQTHLKVGPPVYFIVKDGYNYSDVQSLRLLCGASNCDADSLQSIISSASFFPNETYIAQSTVNWIDDYMEWLNSDPSASTSSQCCYINSETNQFCDVKHFENKIHKTKKEEEFYKNCISCPINRTTYQFPTDRVILTHIESFLKQNPGDTCIKAGHAMYGDAVNLKRDPEFPHKVKGIGSSHFMAYHTVLSTSDDFVNAMKSANQISEKITKVLNRNNNGSKTDTNYEVVPYSIFYVFYEQYLKIWQDATAQLLTTLVAIFICTFILLSFDLVTSLIVTGVIAIIIIDMVGIMFLWNIELNAISLVNLVIAIGISVEFSAHIARAFATSNAKTKKKRAADALCNMGPPVFSGVVQSIVGISVLAFAHSQLFQVFYFRMYFSILFLGLTHSLVFLPVLLSYIGPTDKIGLEFKGRPKSHLKYYKENSQKNISTSSYERDQEMVDNLKISQKDVNNNQPDTFIHLSQSNLKNKMDASPSIKSYRDRHYFSKIGKTRSDRELSFSRKSFDCLINEQNEANSNSSNDCNIKDEKETNIDRDCTDENNNEKKYSPFSSKLSSIRSKLDGSFKLGRKSNTSNTTINNESNKNESLDAKDVKNKEKVSDRIVPIIDNSHISIPNITLEKSPSFNNHGTISEPRIIKDGLLSQSFSVKNC